MVCCLFSSCALLFSCILLIVFLFNCGVVADLFVWLHAINVQRIENFIFSFCMVELPANLVMFCHVMQPSGLRNMFDLLHVMLCAL